MKNLHAFTSHRDNCRRYFATYRINGDDLRRIEGKVEIAFRPGLGKGGFRFHLGDRGSATPVDGMLNLGRVAIFWGVNAPGLGRLCERIGRGHPTYYRDMTTGGLVARYPGGWCSICEEWLVRLRALSPGVTSAEEPS